jgi:hypothetical protein
MLAISQLYLQPVMVQKNGNDIKKIAEWNIIFYVCNILENAIAVFNFFLQYI